MSKKSYTVIDLHSFHARIFILFAVYVVLLIAAVLDTDAKQPIYLWMVFGIVFYLFMRTFIRWSIAAVIIIYVSIVNRRRR